MLLLFQQLCNRSTSSTIFVTFLHVCTHLVVTFPSCLCSPSSITALEIQQHKKQTKEFLSLLSLELLHTGNLLGLSVVTLQLWRSFQLQNPPVQRQADFLRFVFFANHTRNSENSWGFPSGIFKQRHPG